MPEIIAEIGVNHNKSEKILTSLIKGAKNAGADYVKFQRFVSSDEISNKATLAAYQNTKDNKYESQLKMAQDLEMSDELLTLGVETCKRFEIKPLCSPFEMKSIFFIKEALGMRDVKVPSPEITNIPYLEAIAENFDKAYISTGASHLWEVAYALDIIKNINPNIDIILMHCVSEYPAPLDSLNLSAMKTLSQAFKLPVGFSDHSSGILGSIAALSLGAEVIEKHITLDKNFCGPDHKASITIDELGQICEFGKEVKSLIGNGLKIPSSCEIDNRRLIRKSIYLNVDKLSKGSILKEGHVECKRPFNENLLSPIEIKKFFGKKINKDKFYDEGIFLEDFLS